MLKTVAGAIRIIVIGADNKQWWESLKNLPDDYRKQIKLLLAGPATKRDRITPKDLEKYTPQMQQTIFNALNTYKVDGKPVLNRDDYNSQDWRNIGLVIEDNKKTVPQKTVSDVERTINQYKSTARALNRRDLVYIREKFDASQRKQIWEGIKKYPSLISGLKENDIKILGLQSEI